MNTYVTNILLNMDVSLIRYRETCLRILILLLDFILWDVEIYVGKNDKGYPILDIKWKLGSG